MRRLALATSLLGLAACVRDSPAPLFPFCADPPPIVPDGGPPLTWQDVGPLFMAHCAGCHTAGGIAPFPLESPADVAAEAPAVRAAVLTRLMPPWPLAHCCQSYQGDPSLTDAEIGALVSWIDQGMAPGTGPALEAQPAGPSLARVDLTLGLPAPYQPRPTPGSTDELRCFAIPWPETTTKYVTAFDVRPTAPSEVHHARAFLMPKGAPLPGSSGADGRPGWSCPNGVPGSVGVVGGWRPGALPEALPDGLGYRVDPGSQIVLSLHYRAAGGAALYPDQTQMRFTLEDQVARPAQLVFLADPGWLQGGMRIPAGDPDAAFAWEMDPSGQSGGKPITVYAANLHMHEHGRKMIVGVRHRDGSLDCIAEAPNWSYDQVGEDYFLASPMQLEAGDKLHVECHFDNSAGTTDLNWGNDQEMCVGYVTASW
ncbi:MAG: monooxygenase [Deltaproteobacteria bacterium]